MARKEFDPIDHARDPREEGWKEETEEIADLLHRRGDLRIGQLIVNAVSREVEFPDKPETEKDIEKLKKGLSEFLI